VPGVPYSAAYGKRCLAANAHPWFIVVANTAAVDGLDGAADWWVAMVEDTSAHLGSPFTLSGSIGRSPKRWRNSSNGTSRSRRRVT
jgi:hypothetical protein